MLRASDLFENAPVQARDLRTMTPAQRCAADRRAALCRLAGGGRSEAGQYASPTLSIRTELTGLTDLPRGTAGHPDRRAHPGCLPASSSRRRSSSRPTGASSPTAIAESFVDSFKTELIGDIGWFNSDRLHESLGYVSPAKYEHQRPSTGARYPHRSDHVTHETPVAVEPGLAHTPLDQINVGARPQPRSRIRTSPSSSGSVAPSNHSDCSQRPERGWPAGTTEKAGAARSGP
jgi:hypothetical protein